MANGPLDGKSLIFVGQEITAKGHYKIAVMGREKESSRVQLHGPSKSYVKITGTVGTLYRYLMIKVAKIGKC